MRAIILITFSFICLFNQAAIASPTALTTSLILQSFPVCSISYSLGQKCNSLSDNERVNFAPSNINDAARDFINEERLEIVTEGWNYAYSGNNT